MRVTTIVLCIGVFLGAVILVVGAVGTGLLCGVSRLFTLSEWSVGSMTIESFDYHEQNIHMRVVVGARAWSSNGTRASSITIPVARGRFSLALDGKHVGNGTVAAFPLSHNAADVELVLDQAGIPLDRGDIFKRYIGGSPVTVSVRVTSLTFLMVPLRVERTAEAAVLITDGERSDTQYDPWGTMGGGGGGNAAQ